MGIKIPKNRAEKRVRRHLRVRKTVQGTSERPRLVVYRSLKHITAQLVDDQASRTLIANMVEGVTKGFTKNLELVGVGYKAEVRPYGLQLALGYSHAIEYKAPKGITLSAPVPTQITVEGANKEVVGQVAAEIRSLRPPEPYKGKGIKYSTETIRRKEGKKK